ncbi:hydrogenase nickel incorporation protein HypB [Leeia speluncae]|uniref:hydrogenase nickel incorporation protein HypB n=1 Tax=Leeia speluncae TaxID=2884804 RepID=UPI0022218AD9|nr:hydrogenase nickel incorporation protein HypB [Leeia speluncae]
MCTVCGCADGNVQIEGASKGMKYPYRPKRGHVHAHHHHHDHTHPHDHVHEHSHTPTAVAVVEEAVIVNESTGDRDYGQGPAHAHAPGMTQARMVKIEQDILGKNQQLAEINRKWFADRGVFAINLVSSPGSGKTTLLTETIKSLQDIGKVYVIEGDQQTTHDADRIRATGAAALQINTGKGCHLDAHMVGEALPRLNIADNSLVLIENVGNLVCPSAFDLGEAHKVAVLSVTEGEDKPLKYPDMFAASDVMILNKIDLLPYLDFDVDAAIGYAKRVNPNIRVIQVSARKGDGMDEWLDWLHQGMNKAQLARQQWVQELEARIAVLEAQLAAQTSR